jgi:hypothetical protein
MLKVSAVELPLMLGSLTLTAMGVSPQATREGCPWTSHPAIHSWLRHARAVVVLGCIGTVRRAYRARQ